MWRRAIIVGVCCIIIVIFYCRWRCPCRICPPPPAVDPVECKCPEWIEVVINDQCSPMYATGGAADPLSVDPGDVVIWTNKNSGIAEISFTSGSPFYTDYIKIEPGAQYVIRVRDNAGGTPPVEYEYDLKCGGGTVTTPKVSVGGGP